MYLYHYYTESHVLRVLVSSLHRHCCSLYLYHLKQQTLQYIGHYVSCIHLLHWKLSFHVPVSPLHNHTERLLFHVHVPLIHGYIITLDTITRILCTLLFHVLTLLLHIFTSIHVIDCFYIFFAWITAPITWIILHGLFLHGYFCIPLIWLFPVTDIDNPVTRHECCWYAMWRTTCHVDLRMGATSRIPHFLFLIFSLSYFIISA